MWIERAGGMNSFSRKDLKFIFKVLMQEVNKGCFGSMKMDTNWTNFTHHCLSLPTSHPTSLTTVTSLLNGNLIHRLSSRITTAVTSYVLRGNPLIKKSIAPSKIVRNSCIASIIINSATMVKGSFKYLDSLVQRSVVLIRADFLTKKWNLRIGSSLYKVVSDAHLLKGLKISLNYKVEDQICNLICSDTWVVGDLGYRWTVGVAFYCGANCCVLMYDLNVTKSFDDLNNLREDSLFRL
ncbi:unnamed protein product [Lactuca saligna]|uniref:Uncharacterized protein n=1 Tax=Lactuca saligna TaxID=75948 RepID=A0AA35YP77_LACSI|nr:unnamed protein product [Lactuca saligna]